MPTNPKFRINGLVDTNNNVLDNINTLANHSGAFITWDTNAGQWTSILNSAVASVYDFDDTNIVGEINVSGTGMDDLFNKVSVSYPHRDLRDTTDVIEVSLAQADRFTNELDNTLEISLPQCNDPIQAQYIAGRELKQNRLDLIIEFRSHFEANSLKAGDIVTVTNSGLDFTSKEFRVIQIQEEDTDEGDLIFSITAQEYDGTIYTESGLSYETRTHFNGIKSKVFNAEITKSDDADSGKMMARLLGANALLGIANGLLKKFVTADPNTGVLTEDIQFNDKATNEMMTAGAKKPNLTHAPATGPTGAGTGTSADPIQLCPGTSTTLSMSHDCEVCFINTPNYTYDYTITGLASGEVDIPLTGEVVTTGSNASLTFTPTVTADTTFNVEMGGATTHYRVLPEPTEYISNVTAVASSIQEGASTTVNVVTVGKANGATLNYAITGTGVSKVSTALTGTVTVNSNAASLTVNTTDDSTFGPAVSVTVTFTPHVDNLCSVTNNTATISVTNNATTGPQPPADFECEYAQVPVVWCGMFDGTTQYLKSVGIRRYMYLPVAPVGGVAVPTSVSVTNPGTASASITIDSTVNIDNVTGAGGMQIDVLTAFDTPPSGGDTLLTGTVSTFIGYDL